MTAKELAFAALNQDAADTAQRLAYLQSACAGDEALLAEARAILENTQELASDPFTVTLPGAEITPLEVIGHYRLVRKLGAGGMGVVYQARQAEPIRRDVALKVIKPGMDSRQVIARFESERQALALMDHIHIARVFDAGATDRGLPYFVMELVDGVPITTYCNRNQLTVRQQIELFIPVCQAIQHAHQKGVIHRDIKPSNVLVAQQEGRAIPKVIDFGLAKALSGSLTGATVATHVGAIVGTLDYMSPEQAELGRNDVDTRSDIYSLGALLYELLTGEPPLQYSRAAQPSYIELLQCIREQAIPPPSARARTAAQLRERLDRDLDWVAMKCLEKDRARRYETANALARDLQRYLAGEPVEAGPPSAYYRMGKFARKHRLWLGFAAAFFLLLTGAVGVSTWMAVRANRAEAEAQAVSEFLRNDVLAQADTNSQAGPDIKPDAHLEVRTALDRAAARIGGKFHDQPLVEASVRHTIGIAYLDLGLLGEAEQQLQRVFDLRRRLLGEEHSDTLSVVRSLANLQARKGDYAGAAKSLENILQVQRRGKGGDDPDTLDTMGDLADVYEFEGKYALAEPLAKRVLDVRKRTLGLNHPATLAVMNTLAMVYDNTGRYGEAEPLLKQALEQRRRVSGEQHPQTLLMMHNLAGVYRDEGRFREADALLERSLDISRRVSGEEHPETLVESNSLALVYLREGKFAQAEALLEKTLAARRRVSGDEHPETLTVMNNLAMAEENAGRYAEAEKLYAETLRLRERVSGDTDPNTVIGMHNLGMVLYDQGKYQAAEALLVKSISARSRLWGEQDPTTLWFKNNLAVVYEREGKTGPAEELFRTVLGGRQRALGEEHVDTLRTRALLGRLQLRQGRYADAERELEAALATYRKLGADILAAISLSSAGRLGSGRFGTKGRGRARATGGQ